LLTLSLVHARVANPSQCFQLRKSRERMVARHNGGTHVPV
jgi:hypothetical protein